MSASGRKRIDKVEESLTPRQAVLLWLEEATQCGSMRAYVLSLKGGPQSAFPLYRLPDQIDRSVRSAMTGHSRTAVEAATAKAVRDVAFLYYLLVQINGRELADRRANCLQLMLVIERLRTFILGDPLNGERHDQWREFVANLSERLFALEGAAERIAAQYLGGRSPLFPEETDNLRSLHTQFVGMIELYNDRLLDADLRPRRGRKLVAPPPIDLEALRKRTSDAATALVHELVTAAKVEALIMVGERKQAFSLMDESLELV
jgi:hypothetical protein